MYTERDINLIKFGYKGKVNIIEMDQVARVWEYNDNGTIELRFRNAADQLVKMQVTADQIERAMA
jgi:hypothetical protein